MSKHVSLSDLTAELKAVAAKLCELGVVLSVKLPNGNFLEVGGTPPPPPPPPPPQHNPMRKYNGSLALLPDEPGSAGLVAVPGLNPGDSESYWILKESLYHFKECKRVFASLPGVKSKKRALKHFQWIVAGMPRGKEHAAKTEFCGCRFAENARCRFVTRHKLAGSIPAGNDNPSNSDIASLALSAKGYLMQQRIRHAGLASETELISLARRNGWAG